MYTHGQKLMGKAPRNDTLTEQQKQPEKLRKKEKKELHAGSLRETIFQIQAGGEKAYPNSF